MAEQSQADRKSQLIAELERSRSEFAHGVRGLRQDMDVGAHLKHAFVRQKAAWLTGAAITGWLLAKLPTRRKKAKPAAIRPPKPSESERGGILLMLLNMLIPLAKPAVTAFATKKVQEFVSRNGREPKDQRFAKR